METHFVVSSETYAEKARRLLERYRYRFRVHKVTAAAGCAFHFRVSAPAAAIFALLQAGGIPYQTN